MATNDPLVLSAVVTDAGLAAASIASPTGPWVNLVKFSVGSGSGYTPDKTTDKLQGTTLYENAITGYMNVPPKTLQLQCVLPPSAGPFEFGELAIWMPDGVLFCILVFPTLQIKTSSLTTNVASQFTFNVLINLSQGTAIFQITSELLERVQVLGKWSDVLPRSQMADQNALELIVTELDTYNNSSLLHLSSDSKWTLGTNYKRIASTSINNASLTTVDISSTLATADPIGNGWVVQTDQSGFAFELNGITVAGLSSLGALIALGDVGLTGAILPNGNTTNLGNGFALNAAGNAMAITYNGAALFSIDNAGRVALNSPQDFVAFGVPSQAVGVSTPIGDNWSFESSPASVSILNGSTALMTITAAGVMTLVSNIQANGNPLAVLGSSNVNAQLLTNTNRQYVLEFPQTGLFRSAASLVDLGNGNYRFALNPDPLPTAPNPGAPVVIYSNNTGTSLGTAQAPGLLRPGVGIAVDTPGIISARGLLHDAPGTGGLINGQYDLNAVSWNSGVYTVNATLTGGSVPANLPTGDAFGRLYVSAANGVIHQRWVPVSTTQFEFTRSWVVNIGWTPWRYGTTNSPNGASTILRAGFEQVGGGGNYQSESLTSMYDYYVVNYSDCDASVTINGTIVARIGVGPVGTDGVGCFPCSIGDVFAMTLDGGQFTNYVLRRRVTLG